MVPHEDVLIHLHLRLKVEFYSKILFLFRVIINVLKSISNKNSFKCTVEIHYRWIKDYLVLQSAHLNNHLNVFWPFLFLMLPCQINDHCKSFCRKFVLFAM